MDVERDESARQVCKNLTSIDGAVPVTTADGENYVLDFDKPALDKLLNI